MRTIRWWGIARFFAVQCYVPESYFISMVASHNFKWDRCAAWQFRCSPSCVLAFGCCGGATPVGLPSGSSSLLFISAAFVSSIGLLYSFTDLSLCTCKILFSFASIVAAFPILAFAGFFTSFSYSYIHFCSLYLDSSAHALLSPSTRWTFHFVPTFVHSDSPFLAIIITKIYYSSYCYNPLGSQNTFSSFSRVFSEARHLPFPSVFGCWYGILSIYLPTIRYSIYLSIYIYLPTRRSIYLPTGRPKTTVPKSSLDFQAPGSASAGNSPARLGSLCA